MDYFPDLATFYVNEIINVAHWAYGQLAKAIVIQPYGDLILSARVETSHRQSTVNLVECGVLPVFVILIKRLFHPCASGPLRDSSFCLSASSIF